MLFNGLVNLPWWGYVVAALVFTHITIAAVTIFLHRHQAHRALDLHPVVSHFFRFWLWITTGMKTKEWVAVHRKHHANVETTDDPHSPQILGINAVLWRGAAQYRRGARSPGTLQKYGRGTPDDWLERNVYSRFCYSGTFLMFCIDLVLFGLAGAGIWVVQMVWIPFWAAGVINGIGHYWGYRNYEVEDASRNIVPWGIVIGGEELHNNHHTWPSSAKLSSKAWEFDIGWLYIRLMSILRLAQIRKVAPTPRLTTFKPTVDTDTVRAVLTHRFRVMARYCKEVLLPVLADEVRACDRSGRRLFKRARRLLIRDESLLDREAKHKLEALLDVSQQLRIVYAYKQRLQEIWKQPCFAHESPLNALREWCRQAEMTKIRALQDFAHSLRGYTLEPS